MLPVQDPDGASAAKTTSSDRTGGADESGASHLSSRRHQEQVQNLEDQCEVVDGPNDNLLDEMKVPDKKAQITSVEAMWSGHGAAPTPSDCSGGGDGSARAPYPWSLTEEEHLRNLKKNCGRAFLSPHFPRLPDIEEDHPWFVRVVAKARADPFLKNSEVEIKESPRFDLPGARLLHLAVLMGDLEMVQKILETRSVPNEAHIDRRISVLWGSSALDLAIAGGESEIVDALLEKNAQVNTNRKGSLQLAVVHARAKEPEKTSKIIQSLVRKGIDVKAKDRWGYSAFYLAVALGKTKVVLQLLEWQDKIQLNEACQEGRRPIQIAHEDGFKDIETALMRCDDVKWYIDSTIRERQGYVDTSSAILVGAAFIASATFTSWLQPPLNYTTPYHGSSVEYVDIERNDALGCFWVFNSLSFYFAVGTVVLGASSVLPRRQLFIFENVKKLSQNLLLMAVFLAFSMIFVVIAFGIAGFIVLIPILRYQWYMIVPTMVGGMVCVGSVGYLFKSLWEQRPRNIQIRKRIQKSEVDHIKYWYDLISDDVEER